MTWGCICFIQMDVRIRHNEKKEKEIKNKNKEARPSALLKVEEVHGLAHLSCMANLAL